MHLLEIVRIPVRQHLNNRLHHSTSVLILRNGNQVVWNAQERNDEFPFLEGHLLDDLLDDMVRVLISAQRHEPSVSRHRLDQLIHNLWTHLLQSRLHNSTATLIQTVIHNSHWEVSSDDVLFLASRLLDDSLDEEVSEDVGGQDVEAVRPGEHVFEDSRAEILVELIRTVRAVEIVLQEAAKNEFLKN